MVWQRAGTVAVQTGSTTVIGTNVDFAASSRNGDSFVGPDGATYELSNVASSTVISILPAYKGPTVSGAAYAIMPVQGYDKMLSDAFNGLNNQFGPKLAALGTTGNYDILPVSKGGTGGTTQATAIQALGLDGTKAAVTASGIGINSAPSSLFTGVVGFSTFPGSSASPVPGNGGVRITQNLGGNFFSEICITPDSMTAPNLSYRHYDSVGNPGPWNKVYTNQNTTRAADGTLKAI